MLTLITLTKYMRAWSTSKTNNKSTKNSPLVMAVKEKQSEEREENKERKPNVDAPKKAAKDALVPKKDAQENAESKSTTSDSIKKIELFYYYPQ
jgi:hypothetical protein